ncbi:transcription factor S [Candidatus Woesearchaeota archaeon]|nr:transcription factor S [Candidatus Woesearchaeota archaeon]
MVKFCPKCGAILVPGKEGELVCPRCGYKCKGELKLSEKEKSKAEDVAVVEKEREVLPLVKAKCPKCGHDRAYFWEVQTRAADEPATRFFKCEKCKYVWREYE